MPLRRPRKSRKPAGGPRKEVPSEGAGKEDDMNMQSACAEVLAEVDGSLGCIVIDMQTGLTAAAEYRQGSAMNPATVNLVSVLSTDMFQGKLIRQFEGALQRPVASSQGFVREVQMTTEHTNQFMAAVPGWNQTLLVLVTDKTVSVGLGWMAVHRLLGRFGEVARPPAPPKLATPVSPQGAVVSATGTYPQPISGAAPGAPAAPTAQPSEPFPDANRYAPPPTGQSVDAAGGASAPSRPRQAPTRRYRNAARPQASAAAEPPAKAEPEKPRVAMGPRASWGRRK